MSESKSVFVVSCDGRAIAVSDTETELPLFKIFFPSAVVKEYVPADAKPRTTPAAAKPAFEKFEFVTHTPTGKLVQVQELQDGSAIVTVDPMGAEPLNRRVRLVDLEKVKPSAKCEIKIDPPFKAFADRAQYGGLKYSF